LRPKRLEIPAFGTGKEYMSRKFWELKSNRELSAAKTREDQERVQVATLYDLGLISNPNKRSRRRQEGDHSRPHGADRVTGSRLKKGTQENHPTCSFSPSPSSLLHIHVELDVADRR
jgi:hypothetical protein